jgi:hypothetical protein
LRSAIARIPLEPDPIDQRRRQRRPETVVDVDDADAARAAVEHPE